MGTKTPKVILYGAPIGVLAGLLAGYYQPELLKSLGFLGQLFVSSLRIVVIPLVIAAIAVGIGNLGNGSRVSRTLGATLVYFVATTVIAIVIGMSLAGIVGPGVGVESGAMSAPQQVSQVRHLPIGDYLSTLIPGNHFMAVASGRYFVVILFALLFGAVLATMGQRRRLAVDFFRAVSDALQTLVRWLMWAAPIGLFCLVGAQVAEHPEAIENFGGNMGLFALAVLIGLLIHGLVVLPLILKYLGNRPPWEYLGKMIPALSTAFASNSSMATLPITHQCVVGDSRVDNRAAAAVLPLGAAMNTGGTIMFVMIAVFFVAQSLSLELSVGQVLIMALSALVASLGLAGVPGAGLIILTFAFETADMPEAAYGSLALVAAVEWLLHRGCTTVNVWSDAVGAAVIAVRINARISRRPSPAGRSRTSRDEEPGLERGESRTGRSRRPDDRFSRKRPDRSSRDDDRSRGRRQRPDRPDRSRPEPPAPPADLHRADDESSPFAIKQDNVVDLDERPETDTAAEKSDSSPRGSQRSGRDQQPADSSPRSRERQESRSRSDRPRRGRPADSGGRAPGRPSRDRRTSGTSRGRDARADTSSRGTRSSDRPDAAPAVVDLPDTSALVREQAKVEAQLAELKKRELLAKARLEAAAESSSKDTEATAEETSPQIDYAADDAATSRPAPSPAKSEPSTDDKSEADAAEDTESPVSYGRRRKGHGPRPDAKPKSEGEQDGSGKTDDDLEYETVTVQATSFGRTKKKRTR